MRLAAAARAAGDGDGDTVSAAVREEPGGEGSRLADLYIACRIGQAEVIALGVTHGAVSPATTSGLASGFHIPRQTPCQNHAQTVERTNCVGRIVSPNRIADPIKANRSKGRDAKLWVYSPPLADDDRQAAEGAHPAPAPPVRTRGKLLRQLCVWPRQTQAGSRAHDRIEQCLR